MKHEDIKVGDVYNVRVRVVDVDDDTGEITTETANENGYALGFEWCYYAPGEALAFTPITAENGIKNTEPAPKYAPCRLFKEGDIVTPRERNGRIPWGKDTKLIVVDDERMAGVTVRDEESGEKSFICVLFLELVTPVEESETYRVETGGYNRYRIKKGNLEYSYFPFGEHCALSRDEAKAAAEAECARLNAEHRKEQK